MEIDEDRSFLQIARDLTQEINIFRGNPKKYAQQMSLLAQCFEGKTLTFPESGLKLETSEGIEVLKECLLEIIELEELPALMTSQAMSVACEQHVVDMHQNDFCSHVGSSGSTPEVRLSRVGEHREQCGENVVFGMTSARDIVYHMLMDDGSPERGHRANLMNADFHFLGAALGRHPSAEFAVVVLFADHFKAKKASRAELMQGVVDAARGRSVISEPDSHLEVDDNAARQDWDRLMEELKPAHLAVPGSLVDKVNRAYNPKLWSEARVKAEHYCIGSLNPLPGVDPCVVRAFIHRVDGDHDDCIEENELLGVCHRYQLNITYENLANMFDDILSRRHPGAAIHRAITWTELFAAIAPHKKWVPALDMNIELESEKYTLTMEADALSQWWNDIHSEFGSLCDALAPPPRPSSSLNKTGSRQKPAPRNSGAADRLKELNSFLRSVLQAKLQSTGMLLRDHPKVRPMFQRPGEQGALGPIKSAVCMSQRRLWAYKTQPYRDEWMQLLRAIGLNPNVAIESRHPPEGRGEQLDAHIKKEIAHIQSLNVASKQVHYSGLPPGAEQMKVGEPRERVHIRPKDDESKTSKGAAMSSAGQSGQPSAISPWEDKRVTTESLVNKCIKADSEDNPILRMLGQEEPMAGDLPDTTLKSKQQLDVTQKTKPEMSYTFEARQQFQQVLAKQQRASDERKFLAADRSASGSRLPDSRKFGATSLASPTGVRGHFHNSVGVQAHSGSHGWPQSLDVRWEGSHLDHTKIEPLITDPKMSKMNAAERASQFSIYVGKMIPDSFLAKCARSSDQYHDDSQYKHWKHHEYREDVPQRYGKYGRKAFDPQVRDRHHSNPHGISEIDTKPVEEFQREQERVEDFLHRSLPPGQIRHFEQNMPECKKPHKYVDMATRKPVNFHMDGAQNKTHFGYGQNRHSDETDFKLCTRPLHAGQMDRAIPMA
eukprot:TRINITY_DN93058_c0_g1_i1.p1 TRINITY_DN93058_c0_g1~~TRINITY_DN93058_c0_g1_i1.p1  ORF type:complete len:944 (+),score=156.73 TRINITY_DN93058_c0_g1_i1:50-2881(+)